jgi:hypothetical protein
MTLICVGVGEVATAVAVPVLSGVVVPVVLTGTVIEALLEAVLAAAGVAQYGTPDATVRT